MSEKYSDVLILGSDLAGLIAGAFLAKRGLLVTVVMEEKDLLSPRQNIGPNLISALESRLFKNILGRLSLMEQELKFLRKLTIPYQVVLPHHRLDLYTERKKLFQEIKREFPKDYSNLETFYENLTDMDQSVETEKLQEGILPANLWERLKFYRFIRKKNLNERINRSLSQIKAHQEVSRFIEAQLQFLSPVLLVNPFRYQIAKALGKENGQLFEVQGGLGHLKRLFLDKIEAYQGKIKRETHVEKLNFERRKLKSLKLSGFEGELSCQVLLWNTQISKLHPLLNNNLANRSFIKKTKAFEPRFYRSTLQFELPKSFLPVGMRENVLVVDDPKKPLRETNFLHLNIQNSNGSPNETCRINVSYILEKEKLYEDKANFIKRHQWIEKRLKKLMPFCDSHLKLIFPLEENPNPGQSGMLFSTEIPDMEVFRENAKKQPVYTMEANNFAQLFPLNLKTPYKNLYLTSPEILSVLGSEGKFLLALKTIEVIWKQFEGKKQKATKQRRIY